MWVLVGIASLLPCGGGRGRSGGGDGGVLRGRVPGEFPAEGRLDQGGDPPESVTVGRAVPDAERAIRPDHII